MKIKIQVKEPVKFRLIQTGEFIEYKKAGIFEVENDLRTQRIVEQSGQKIKFIKGKKNG